MESTCFNMLKQSLFATKTINMLLQALHSSRVFFFNQRRQVYSWFPVPASPSSSRPWTEHVVMSNYNTVRHGKLNGVNQETSICKSTLLISRASEDSTPVKSSKWKDLALLESKCNEFYLRKIPSQDFWLQEVDWNISPSAAQSLNNKLKN